MVPSSSSTELPGRERRAIGGAGPPAVEVENDVVTLWHPGNERGRRRHRFCQTGMVHVGGDEGDCGPLVGVAPGEEPDTVGFDVFDVLQRAHPVVPTGHDLEHQAAHVWRGVAKPSGQRRLERLGSFDQSPYVAGSVRFGG